MAFSLGSGRRRWPCRAGRRGGKGGAGCRHFHVHYHLPRQVCAFSPLRLPAFFSLLPYLLIPPVLFFIVLAFLVCFGWFTLVYFVSSLLRKCNSHECLQSASDATELSRNEEQGGKKEERTEKCVAECTADFATAEVCVEGEQIKEVFVDGFPDESWDMSRLHLTDDCTDDEEHPSCEKLVEEVVIFESNCKDFREISCLDISSEKQQLQDTPVDCFRDDIGNREFSTSCDTAKLFHLQSVEEFMEENRMEVSANTSPEIFELTDNHETRAIVVTSSDNSAYYGSEDEEKKEVEQEKYLKYREALTDDIFEEHCDEQKMVTDHISAISDETIDLNDENETVGLPFDSVCESKYCMVTTSNASFHHTSPYEEDGHEEEVTGNDRAKAKDTTSLVSDFAENHQAEISVASNIHNTPAVAAQENSVNERTEDEDENSCTSEGAPRRLALVRRSPPPWWNLCGVLDVLGGCKD
ncbi:hypothetical protein EJB05_34648, partial [Eragrostis curvula]